MSRRYDPAWRIARRYAFSRNLPRAVNVLSAIALLGMLAGAASLTIGLSVFNGFYFLIRDLYEAFDADLRVEPARGRYLNFDPKIAETLKQTPGVAALALSLEGKALVKYHEHQRVVTVKGVSEDFAKVSDYRTLVGIGRPELRDEHGEPMLVMGASIAYYLNLFMSAGTGPVELAAIADDVDLSAGDPEQAVRRVYAYPGGVFSLQKEYDEQYVLVGLDQARKLFNAPAQVSAYELRLHDPENVDAIKAALQKKLGPDFRLLSWYEQHQTLYEIMRGEKAVGYLILSLMLALAALNIIGSLNMIVLEKTADLAALQVMGATPGLLRRVFLYLGLWVGVLGGGLGVALGVFVCWLQDEYHFVALSGGQTFLIDHFPVRVAVVDLAFVLITVLALSLLAGVYPATRAAKLSIAAALRS